MTTEIDINTQRLELHRFDLDPAAIVQAISELNSGNLVAFPTETVYGIGADAENERALRKIFTAKGRPADHPLIVHLAEAAMMERYARYIPESAWLLVEHFWPGPLTLILRRNKHVSDLVTGGQDTVGLRIPSHPIALTLLSQFNRGIAAPSANRFGRISPTTADHVRSELGQSVDVILDGGSCSVGLESTIVDLTSESPRLLRPGGISRAMLAEVLGVRPTVGDASAPRTPGQLARHYSPQTPLRLAEKNTLDRIVETQSDRYTFGVLALNNTEKKMRGGCWVSMPRSAELYARDIYARLHELDRGGYHMILVETPPATKDWDAVRDRLNRAAAIDFNIEQKET